jgi:4-amino-4-deoxy-L-arabinose transferase-like glycosyltransferase
MASARTAVTIVLLAAGTAAMYAHRLASAPAHLEVDEVIIGNDAYALAATGRDLRGERLPLYSQTADHSWYQPWVIYLTAAALTVLPLAEWSVRTPTVCFAVVNIVLTYLLARRVLKHDGWGIVAALLLTLTPAHFLHSRYAMDYMYPATVVLAWCLCLVRYADRPSVGNAALAAAVLGLGFYSYITSIVTMPLYFVITCAFLWHYRAPTRTYVAAAATFGACLIPFLIWFAGHPGAFGATVDKYAVYDRGGLSAVQGLRALFGYVSISQRLSTYWNVISPSVLFLTGGSRVMFSTGKAGVFLLPLIVFVPLGIYEAVLRRGSMTPPMAAVFIAGFLTAALPAMLVTDESAPVFRALALVPFGLLLAAVGVAALWRAGSTPALTQGRRVLVVALLALAAWQFTAFWSDYFGDYRLRASPWLGGNLGGALEAILAREDSSAPQPVYFATLKSTSGIADGRNEYVDAYWRFYATKHHRADLVAAPRHLDPAAVDAVPRGALVLANIGDVAADTLVASGALKRVATIPELNGPAFFTILQR